MRPKCQWFCPLAAALLSLGCGATSVTSEQAVAPKLEVQPREIDFAEELASHNKAPPFVTTKDGGYYPAFPEDYDFEEEKRIRRVLTRLGTDFSEAVWKSVASHRFDDRFAIVARTSEKVGRDMTVGSLCQDLARLHLTHVGMRHFHFQKANYRPLAEPPIYDLMDGRYSFYEAQILACERIVAMTKALERVEEEQRERTIQAVEEEVRKLLASGKPVPSPAIDPYYVAFPPGFDHRTFVPGPPGSFDDGR